MNPRAPPGPAAPEARQELILASCPVPTYILAPACLPQSPPAAKPGPHLGVILFLTSSRHLGLWANLWPPCTNSCSHSANPCLALAVPGGLTTNSQPCPILGLQATGLALTGS